MDDSNMIENFPEDSNTNLSNIKSKEPIIREADVQDIINMMKEDLEQVKLNTKNDETSLNDVESPKSSRQFDESNDINYTHRSAVNETSSSQSRAQDYYAIESTECENPECTDCVVDINEISCPEPEVDEYEEEFKVDDSDVKYAEVVEFIEKAKEFGANALDLSKKNLSRIPKNLMDLKHLQYIYLEGNNITKLPKNFFEIFQELRWLDLRNNKLVELPTLGLSELPNLRSLLLENNQIKKLPEELANVRTLSALSMSDNPLEYPSEDVVNKGFRHLQQFLRTEMLKKQLHTVNKNNKNLEELIKDAEDEYYEIQSITDDVWASDGEDNTARYSTVSKLPDTPAKDTENGQKEKLKLLNKRQSLPPVEIAVYKNEELEKALRNGTLEKYKKSKEKIDAKIQKINDFKMVDDFRTELKIKQRQNANKRLIKGVDYVEPVYKAPFEISEEHKTVMTNEQREFVDRELAKNQGRSLSPESLWRVEETRRARDKELENKIVEYKNKLLARRSKRGSSSNPKNDRQQAARDLKELKMIEKELSKRRSELQHNFRSFTGDIHYKELAKLDSKSNLAAILKAAKMNSSK